jgi:hypothetical protein
MQQKMMGTTLSILGIAGLVLSLFYVTGSDSNSHLALLMAAGIAGAAAFFAGIWLFDRPGVLAKKTAGMSLMGLKEGKAALLRMREEGVSALIRGRRLKHDLHHGLDHVPVPVRNSLP